MYVHILEDCKQKLGNAIVFIANRVRENLDIRQITNISKEDNYVGRR